MNLPRTLVCSFADASRRRCPADLAMHTHFARESHRRDMPRLRASHTTSRTLGGV